MGGNPDDMPAATSLFRIPGATPMVAAGVVGRLPMGMVGLGFTLLIVAQSGSYALAGAVSATTTISLALAAPYGARLADHFGQTRAIPVLLTINVTSFLLLTCAVGLGWPVPLWFAFAALGGMSMPGLGSMTRARWVSMAADGRQRSAAFALESVLDELSFVVGPMIASFLALTFFPAAPILFGLLALTVGGLGLALQRKTAPLPGRGSAPAGRTEARTVHVARFPGVGSLFAMLLALGAMFGLVNLSVVAFASSADPALTGLLLAALSFGSLVSGIVLGVVARTWRLTTQVRVAVLTLTLALAPLALITAPWLFAAVAFLAGLSVSTVMIGTFGLVERMVPRTRITEGMAFIGSALSLGMAAGTSVAGVLIDTSGTSVSLAAAALCAGSAAAVFWARLPRISAAEAGADSRDHSSGQTPHDAEFALSAAGTA